jgi:adenosylcobinamide kinase/adenosylcobinamide-phosphate guanylyltransferase
MAESMLADTGPVDYVATGHEPDQADSEWQDRVRLHARRRPQHWTTIETLDLEPILGRSGAAPPALIDCLTTWLARVMDDCGVWAGGEDSSAALERRLDDLVAAWHGTARRVVAVSNEVGSGIVPGTASGRRFRDELGSLNARIAAASEEVWLCVAGIGQRLR